MFEQDPADAALDEILAVRREQCLIVTSWPGQVESQPHPAPQHMRESLLSGHAFPFVREASQQQLQDYGLDHNLYSPELTKMLTKL